MLCTLTPKHGHLFPAVFSPFYLEERWGIDVQTRSDISRTVEAIEVKLLLGSHI